jgi:hypothetical protein
LDITGGNGARAALTIMIGALMVVFIAGFLVGYFTNAIIS